MENTSCSDTDDGPPAASHDVITAAASSRDDISQLQKTLRASVHRWKFKAFNDCHQRLITNFPLTNGVIGDVMKRLRIKYPIAERNFCATELQVSGSFTDCGKTAPSSYR